jgi:hypothetical protein
MLRENMSTPESSMEYLYEMEALHKEHFGHYHFIQKPFRAFYGTTQYFHQEVQELRAVFYSETACRR